MIDTQSQGLIVKGDINCKMSIILATKSIISNGRNIRIVLPDEKNPGALAALANVLLLNPNQPQNEKMKKLIKLVQKNTVIEKDLEQVLASIGSKRLSDRSPVDELEKKLANISLHRSHSANSKVGQLAQALPSLNEVDPVFDGTFKDEPKLGIFGLYGVSLLHGWLIDTEKHPQVGKMISKISYEEAQEEFKKEKPVSSYINFFFDRSDTQLTEKGLDHLRGSVNEGSFAILFRCNKFYTLHKKKGELLYLVTDKNLREVVWHSLRSIDGVNDTFYSGDFEAIDDEFTKEVQEWMDKTISSIYEPYRSKLEVEMKYGIMIDPKTKKRVKLSTPNPVVYKGRVKMKPNIDQKVFQEFKEYMSFAYGNSGVVSRTQDSMYRVNIGFQKTRFLRKSVDMYKRKPDEIIEKKPVSSLFIHRPRDSYDMKLSINLELPIAKKKILKNCKKPISIRQKNRISYFKNHSDCRIDVTDVQRKMNESHFDDKNKNKVETTHEVEVELFAPDLLLGWQIKNEEKFLFNQFVRIFLNTTNIIDEELTFLTENLKC